jgi:hypothetical protein
MRKIHLYVGLSLLTFVTMYFVTGYVLIHDDWFRGRGPEKTTWTATVSVPAAGQDFDARAYAQALKDRLRLPGKPMAPQRQKDGRWKFSYMRPGDRHEVLVAHEGEPVQITRIHGGARELLVGFHRLHGWNGGWLHVAWALSCDLASLSLLVFVATGIAMWWKRSRRRWPGWLCLGASFSYVIGTVLYFVYAP